MIEIETRSYTVKSFCDAESITPQQLYLLWKRGEGPRFYVVGTHRRITPEARKEWHAEHEAVAAQVAAHNAEIRRAAAAVRVENKSTRANEPTAA